MAVRMWCALITAAVAAHTALADRIELRDGAGAVDGRVRLVNEDGVTLETDNSASRIISWDRICDISPPPDEAELARFQDMAAKLWRARTRVERGDHRLAEPIFEEFFEQFLGRRSETALVVMEGLLRCRLARGANDLAVVPALEVARLRLSGVTTQSYQTLPSMYDSATALCPYLPPFWAPSLTLVKVARQLGAYDAKDQPVVIAMTGLYRLAAQRQAGLADSPTALPSIPDHAGVQLLRAVIDADPNGEALLLKQAAAVGPWAEAWARFALGEAMLASQSEDQRQAGMLNLMCVPAQCAESQPYLSGLALAEVSEALANSGRVEDAGTVRAELQRVHPHHPILATLPASAGSQDTKGGS